MLTQYYNIKFIAVAPYDYISDGNTTNSTTIPVLHASVVQHDKWKFDASNHDIYLSTRTHECELLEGKEEEDEKERKKRGNGGGVKRKGRKGNKMRTGVKVKMREGGREGGERKDGRKMEGRTVPPALPLS